MSKLPPQIRNDNQLGNTSKPTCISIQENIKEISRQAQLVLNFFEMAYCKQYIDIEQLEGLLHDNFVHISKDGELDRIEYLELLSELPHSITSPNCATKIEILSDNLHVVLRLTYREVECDKTKMMGAACYKVTENQISEQFIVWG